ncbi:MAG: ABC transporter ATP-binding protein [Magnetococcus sp. DMHC-6]
MNNHLLLQANQLKRFYRTPAQTVEVLKGIDLSVQRGEMVALLGVSGSGKSTLLQILGGLDHPTQGQVWLDGVDIFALSHNQRAALRNRRVGFVYQFHRLLAEFTALENVMMPLLIGRLAAKEAKRRATETLKEVGLSHRLDHKPGQLSGGEQQRVAIARAVVTRPDLLLADEPTGNLDRTSAEWVFDLLLGLNRQMGLSCLVVTHNNELADRVQRRIYLSDGLLVAHEESEHN